MKSKLNVLLISLGTDGDVHPFVGVGIALRDRGHRVTLITNEHFKRLADENGFSFVATGSAESFNEILQDPNLWKSLHGARTLARNMLNLMPDQYHAIVDHHEPGQTVVVTSGAVFGARIAQDKFNIPTAMLVLQPSVIRSIYDMPIIAGIPTFVTKLPPFLLQAGFRLMDFLADRVLDVNRINAFRNDLGLKPIRRIIKEWWLSPQLVIAMFPEWFCPRQRDWPKQIRLASFPLFDERREGDAMPDPLRAFLSAGDAPIAFTPGSGMMHGQSFFAAAVEACEKLGRRGLLLTRHRKHLPNNLPVTVKHVEYVPFSQLLPHCAALVHHGGVGTLSQALAAGIPQLVMPLAYDQPDNANRLKKLGVADFLIPRAFKGPAVATKLQHLLTSPSVAARCKELASSLQTETPIPHCCDLIESLVDQPT